MQHWCMMVLLMLINCKIVDAKIELHEGRDMLAHLAYRQRL